MSALTPGRPKYEEIWRRENGWREGSWSGFSSDFTDPPPWYFRTLESWIKLFTENGLRLLEVREPVHPETGKPVSVILIGESLG